MGKERATQRPRPFAKQQEETNLEHQVQRHLNLPRASDSFIYGAEAGRTVVEPRVGTATTGGQRGCPVRWKIVVVLVLRNIIDRDVETCSVGNVEDVQGVFQQNPFRDFQILDQGYVRSLLPDLPEDVALTRGKVGLIGIARSNRPT